MTELVFEGDTLAVSPGSSVLEALLAAGKNVSNSCRSGICHSCLLRAVEGTPPPPAQAGLRDTLRAQGYFLACVCKPQERMVVTRPSESGLRCSARIAKVRRLNELVAEVLLRSDQALDYRPGQFVNLVHPEGAVRSYSLASVPEEDSTLHLHVARVPNGFVSGWLHDHAQEGDAVDLLGPHGNCFYIEGNAEQPLLLAGTGTGLAPLYGIAKDALRRGHNGPVYLFHGSVRMEGLYLVDELRALSRRHPNLHYFPCVLEGPAASDVHVGPLDVFIASVLASLKGFRVFLCGHPDLVKLLQKKTFLMGASMKEIFADAFLPSKSTP